jgi:long-chain acyl-CoA synthetase
VVFLEGVFPPLFRLFLDHEAEGVEHLRGLEPPVIFAANHTSHLDAGAVALSLPRSWRYRLSPIITVEWFRPHLRSRGQPLAARTLRAVQYFACCALGDAMFVADGPCSLRRSLVYLEGQMNRGICPLFFPEGTRTPDGKMHGFEDGIGWLATRLGVPVVPVAIDGLFQILPKHARWPNRGRVRVRLGETIRGASTDDYKVVAKAIEQTIRSLMETMDDRGCADLPGSAALPSG